jgi:hypothetical protein
MVSNKRLAVLLRTSRVAGTRLEQDQDPPFSQPLRQEVLVEKATKETGNGNAQAEVPDLVCQNKKATMEHDRHKQRKRKDCCEGLKRRTR